MIELFVRVNHKDWEQERRRRYGRSSVPHWCSENVLCGICNRNSFDCLSSFYSVPSSSFLSLPLPPVHLPSMAPSCSSLAACPTLPTQVPWWGWRGSLCCGCPVYAIPLVLKWQAGDRYAILKIGLMNFWHLISCFPVNISLLAGAWRAPPGPSLKYRVEKKRPAATSNVFPSNVSSNHSTKVN